MKETLHDIEMVYRLHSNAVYRLAYSMLKDKQDAEDATQAVFEKLLTHWPPCPPDEVLGWLIVCTRNHCADVLGSAHRRKRVAYNPDIMRHGLVEESFSDDDLIEALLALPDDLKCVVHLYYHMGYSSVEIARMLDQPETTVRTHLGKARKILRERLEGNV